MQKKKKKKKENAGKIFCFGDNGGDNGVWTFYGNLSLLWGEFMWLAVNVLPNSLKISDLTKTDVS